MKYKEVKHFPLKKLREENKLTVREFAYLSGIHYTYISRLENEKFIASMEMLEKIKETFNKLK